MTSPIDEADLEDLVLSWFSEMHYHILHGPDIAPGEPDAERSSYEEVLFPQVLNEALARLNPAVPSSSLEEVVKTLSRVVTPNLLESNMRFHRYLTDGFDVEFRKDGQLVSEKVWLVDFANPDNNRFMAVNQFTVVEGKINRRPDIVLFLNGIPFAVIELKNPADENATIWSAYNQLQTYKQQISSLFMYNEALVISDGLDARIGSLSASKERFMPWRTIAGEEVAPKSMLKLEVLIRGFFDKRRLLDYIRHFVVFEKEGDEIIKKMAAYHQYHAVNKAVAKTVQASSPEGDKRCGVVWHTQGSGKSLTMAFYSGKIILHPSMANPTLVVITDRNDLDDQLFGTFSRCSQLLRQDPVQVENRKSLRENLKVAAGGVVFTTVQKFFPSEKGDDYPLLSDRRNIIVIADEAHRSQYDFVDGFARHMRDALPNASFIGFTGTPIEFADKNTQAVFGEYVSIYDIQRAF